MPCYCDTPDSENQAEIEKRCKRIMYFDLIEILTDEQKDIGTEKGIKFFPQGDLNEHLCKICKIATREQMKEISAYYYDIEWPHKTLYDWHIQHCKDDINFNKEDKENASV